MPELLHHVTGYGFLRFEHVWRGGVRLPPAPPDLNVGPRVAAAYALIVCTTRNRPLATPNTRVAAANALIVCTTRG